MILSFPQVHTEMALIMALIQGHTVKEFNQ